jgi:hypothetical protein
MVFITPHESRVAWIIYFLIVHGAHKRRRLKKQRVQDEGGGSHVNLLGVLIQGKLRGFLQAIKKALIQPR